MSLRELEALSLRRFVESCAPLLAQGRVLDYGCGRSPYRDLVAGEYVGYEDPELPAHVRSADITTWLDTPLKERWHAILCTQVVQYVEHVPELLEDFRIALKPSGLLVLTGPTNWPEVEPEDLHRFTRAGIERLLRDAGFLIDRCEERAHVLASGERFSLGWGAVAYA